MHRERIGAVEHLTLKRGSFLLDDISFDIYEDEILAIIGENGAGKTMLLESIAGFHKDAQGAIAFAGERLDELPLQERRIGYLYQEYCLFPHMTARENIGYGLKMRGMKRPEIARCVERIAEELEITSVLEQYPSTLSGGEQQRVALARALITEPKLLLLDEPFSALDRVTKQKLYDMMSRIHEQYHCAIVFVTHDFREAELFSDRVGVLLDGKMCGIVESSQLFEKDWCPQVRAFLGKEEE